MQNLRHTLWELNKNLNCLFMKNENLFIEEDFCKTIIWKNCIHFILFLPWLLIFKGPKILMLTSTYSLHHTANYLNSKTKYKYQINKIQTDSNL